MYNKSCEQAAVLHIQTFSQFPNISRRQAVPCTDDVAYCISVLYLAVRTSYTVTRDRYAAFGEKELTGCCKVVRKLFTFMCNNIPSQSVVNYDARSSNKSCQGQTENPNHETGITWTSCQCLVG